MSAQDGCGRMNRAVSGQDVYSRLMWCCGHRAQEYLFLKFILSLGSMALEEEGHVMKLII
jgi:hypothetical protein